MNTYYSKSDLRYKLENFAQSQPELLLIGALVGGFLLGYFAKSANGRSEMHDNRSLNAAYSSRAPGRTQNGANYATPAMSSARLGATEEQVNYFPQQSAASAISRDEVSTTGTAYELDPKSITGG